jgi:hypothetical protein
VGRRQAQIEEVLVRETVKVVELPLLRDYSAGAETDVAKHAAELSALSAMASAHNEEHAFETMVFHGPPALGAIPKTVVVGFRAKQYTRVTDFTRR